MLDAYSRDGFSEVTLNAGCPCLPNRFSFSLVKVDLPPVPHNGHHSDGQTRVWEDLSGMIGRESKRVESSRGWIGLNGEQLTSQGLSGRWGSAAKAKHPWMGPLPGAVPVLDLSCRVVRSDSSWGDWDWRMLSPPPHRPILRFPFSLPISFSLSSPLCCGVNFPLWWWVRIYQADHLIFTNQGS